MPKVEIYSTRFCLYCLLAKRLLRRKGVAFRVIDVTFRRGARAQMRKRAYGQHSVPQIFVGDRHIGGCEELYDLDRRGELDRLLAS